MDEIEPDYLISPEFDYFYHKIVVIIIIRFTIKFELVHIAYFNAKC